MSTAAEPELPAHQPLSSDELARAVSRLGRQTLSMPLQATTNMPPHETSELRMMTAAQRFWLAFTGKPGSSGRAGPGHETGLPRSSVRHSDDAPFGIPRQRNAAG